MLLGHNLRLIAAEFLAWSLGGICGSVVAAHLYMNMFMFMM
ncbi:hypothetical protein [Polaromonas sp.]|nr:hypothetical protein [Polaromonas sp.]